MSSPCTGQARPAATPNRPDRSVPLRCAPRNDPINCLTVDVEDFFQAEAFASTIGPQRWSRYRLRVEIGVERLLELLHDHNVHITFFVLGWIARRLPGLIRRIQQAGHEVASHGYWHQHLARSSPADFRRDLRTSCAVLEDIVGQPIVGFRAPTFSLTRKTAWAAELLVEQGLLYDSSVFPVHHDRYGIAAAPDRPYWLCTAAGRILELPPLTVGSSRLKLPAAGGGYLRVLPAGLVRWAIARANAHQRPAVLYVHPWELDPHQPRPPLPLLARIRHYGGMDRLDGRLRHLLASCHFRPMIDLAWQQSLLCRRTFCLPGPPQPHAVL